MKKNAFNITVPFNCHGYRIDKFLQSQINELSRTRLQALIHEGQVKLNSTIIKSASKKIKENDKIKVNFQEDLNFGVNDYKLEFKSKTHKVIETVQSEKIINETNVIKFKDKKKDFKKVYVKDIKRKYYKKYKKKTK